MLKPLIRSLPLLSSTPGEKKSSAFQNIVRGRVPYVSKKFSAVATRKFYSPNLFVEPNVHCECELDVVDVSSFQVHLGLENAS